MFGIYIHFPFCRKRCPFCDFAVTVRPELPHRRYADAVLCELSARAPLYHERRARSIYFGGGTPGLWRADCIAELVHAVESRFGACEEVTVECIPGELDLAHARALAAAGVTRLSIGVESLDDQALGKLGRLHSAADGRAAVDIARAAGFANFSIDLMFALPGQTVADWRRQLAQALELGPPHLSVYQLTIEPGTAFARAGVRTPDGADFFLDAHDHLGAAGYVHYEVSSYARPGYTAVHNSLYWRGGEYLGLGMSAHSFRRLPSGAGERFAQTRDLEAYLRDPTAAPVMHETLEPPALRREAIWLWLRRLDEGLPRARFAALYGQDPAREHAATIERLCEQGLLLADADALRLTHRGMLLADEVAAAFLQA
jgi:oxygen-independent coproporphyrinogen-3 oxidase